MIVGVAEIKLYATWVHSLKEKRMIVKSLSAKIRNKFNVSIIEAGDADIHQTITLGLAYVSGTVNLSDSIIDNIISFIEDNTEAEIINIKREIR